MLVRRPQLAVLGRDRRSIDELHAVIDDLDLERHDDDLRDRGVLVDDASSRRARSREHSDAVNRIDAGVGLA
jgi:hypothetical protein